MGSTALDDARAPRTRRADPEHARPARADIAGAAPARRAGHADAQLAGSRLAAGAGAARALGTRRALLVGVLRVVVVLSLFAYAAHSIAGVGGHRLDSLFEDWVFNGLLVLGAALCLLRAVWLPLERRAWAALGIGLACWALGEIIFTLDPGQVEAGFPATSDWLWLVFYPASFLSLGLLVRARARQFYASLWLDGGVGALAVAAIAGQFVLPVVLHTTGGSVSSVVGDLIYPLGDLLLACFAVAVLALTGWRPGRALGAVVTGLALGTAADMASLYLSATGHSGSSAFDSLWPASAVVLGAAAWQPARPSAVIGLHGRRLLVFPLAFTVAALGLLAVQLAHPVHSAAYALALLTIAGAVVRMGLTFGENVKLVDRSRHEALTDPLTGLGNRRRLLLALEDALQSASERAPLALLLFDLNGFKRYNDTFGHPVGDALLARLGAKLAHAVAPDGQAYRLGGDEFCVLTRLERHTPLQVASVATDALSERGQGFDITAAHGCIMLPQEATGSSTALTLVDERLYADKRSRQTTEMPDQMRDVLVQVMAERQPDLHAHLSEVALMARTVGQRMGLSGEDLEILVRAAALHDVGKLAVPDVILHKTAALDAGERAIVERHCEVGERILAAAPAMGPVARLVRSSHESFDGRGYPDGRKGEEIPLGARIIAVCDAFHSMTTDRPYHRGIDADQALAELQRAAGSQFDPRVVSAFLVALKAGELSDMRA
jgi:diguanylate cyclase (GGDEF)-like protein